MHANATDAAREFSIAAQEVTTAPYNMSPVAIHSRLQGEQAPSGNSLPLDIIVLSLTQSSLHGIDKHWMSECTVV